MTYRAPLDDLLFAMTHGAGLKEGLDNGIYADLADGMAGTLLAEAARFAEDVLAPINRAGDDGSDPIGGTRSTPNVDPLATDAAFPSASVKRARSW